MKIVLGNTNSEVILLKYWYPQEIWYENEVELHHLGREILNKMALLQIPLKPIAAHNKARLEINDPQKRFIASKRVLILGTKKDLKLIPCLPSADYRIVIGTSCPAFCEYCYLSDSLGERVFPRVYVNLDEILNPVLSLLKKERKKTVSFELSSSGDPLATEHLTGLLGKTIAILGQEPNTQLRVVTKYDHVEPLLLLAHNQKTFFRFSLNTEYVITNFEHGTSSLKERISAAEKLAQSGYPLGVIIAPIILYKNWENDYFDLVKYLADKLPFLQELELITFRFSKRSKSKILTRFPNSKLPFPQSGIRHKAFGKYVYDEDSMNRIQTFFSAIIAKYFPHSKIAYFI